MKMTCQCGSRIVDATDNVPWKSHFIADQNSHDLLDAIDRLIEGCADTSQAREAACSQVRSLISRASRLALQCMQCGRLHLNDQDNEMQTFIPESGDVSHQIFRARI